MALAAWVAAPAAPAAAAAMLAGGLAAGLRLARWQGWRTRREPLLLALHLGHGWLAAGLLLLGLASLRPALPPALAPSAALHALTVGAIGTMTLAVMARAALSHTGRRVAGGPGHWAMLALVTLAAVLRVLAPLAGAHAMAALTVAGLAWSGAFALFLLRHAGMLVRPRRRGRPA
ncbi:MAG: NnrS family protein [Dongiaceae bacterium]